MRKSEREVRGQASDEGEQEAGEWWGRARHRRMMGKSERQASDGEEQERHATDGGVQETSK